MRPKSIEQFAIVYAAVIVLGLASTALSWNALMAQVSVQQVGATFAYTIAGLGLLIQVLLWVFITRRGSVVAKWIFVVLTALAILSGVWGLATAGASTALMGIMDIALLVLQVVAIVLLFRPDTPAWFGEDVAE